MKKFVSLILFVCILLCFTLPVSAYTFGNESFVQDGNTCVGVFKVKETSHLDFWREWKSSLRNICVSWPDGNGDFEYMFLLLDTGVNVQSVTSLNGMKIQFSGTGTIRALKFTKNSEGYIPTLFTSYSSTSSITCSRLIGGSYFNTVHYVFPNSVAQYLPEEIQGQLSIVDDLGETPPEEEGNILDWILGFFSNLWDFLIRLIVPSEDYFSNWFDEIHDAAMEKLGPIGEIFGALGDVFSDLQNDNTYTSLTLDIPRNHFFNGFSGVHVDLLNGVDDALPTIKGFLTACVVVLTAIVCYRRVIVIFEGKV